MASERVITLLLEAKDFRRLSAASQRARLIKHFGEWLETDYTNDTVDSIRALQRLQVYASRTGQSIGIAMLSILESAKDFRTLEGEELDAFNQALIEPCEFEEPVKAPRIRKAPKGKTPKTAKHHLTIKEFKPVKPEAEEDDVDLRDMVDQDEELDLPAQTDAPDDLPDPDAEEIKQVVVKPARSVQVADKAAKPVDTAAIKSSMDEFAAQWGD